MIALKGRLTTNFIFIIIVSIIPLTLFLKPGFINGSVILFFTYCIFNLKNSFIEQISKNKTLLLPILLFLLYVVATFYADNYSMASNLLLRRIHLLLIPLGFLLVKNRINQKEVDIILFVFLIACIMASVFCLSYAVYNVIKFQTIVFPTDRVHSYFFVYDGLTKPIRIDPIYLSMFSNLAFAVSLYTPFIEHSKWRAAIACYLGIFIFMIASKIGIIIFGLLLILWIWKKPKKNGIIIFSIICLAVIIWVGVYKLPFLKERFMINTNIEYSDEDSGQWGSTAFRIAIWTCAFDAIEKKPLIGYGTGSGQIALEMVYKEKNFTRGILDFYNAHNEFLSTALDLGIVGVLCLAIVLYFPAINFHHYKDNIGFSFILIIGLTFLVESVFFRQKGIVFFSFFYSLLCWRQPAVKDS